MYLGIVVCHAYILTFDSWNSFSFNTNADDLLTLYITT